MQCFLCFASLLLLSNVSSQFSHCFCVAFATRGLIIPSVYLLTFISFFRLHQPPFLSKMNLTRPSSFSITCVISSSSFCGLSFGIIRFYKILYGYPPLNHPGFNANRYPLLFGFFFRRFDSVCKLEEHSFTFFNIEIQSYVCGCSLYGFQSDFNFIYGYLLLGKRHQRMLSS